MATTKKADTKVDEPVMSATTYTREQVVQSQKYRPYRDVLGTLLEEDRQYTAEQIEKIKDEFLKCPIKEKINNKGE